jgi:hypothetical protein
MKMLDLNDDEVRPEHFEWLRSGKYLRKPKREMIFDAGDARLERHHKLMEDRMKTYTIDKFLWSKGNLVFTAFIVLLVILAAAWFMSNDPKVVTQVSDPNEAPVVLELTTADGNVFICEHYQNGTQICVNKDDPEMGGGRIVP